MRRMLVAIAVVFAACSSDDPERAAQATRSPRPIVEARADLPTPRTEVAGARFGDRRIIVAGGLTADGAASALAHVYDVDRDAWTEAPALPVAVHHASLVWARDRVYLVGGFTTDGAPTSSVWSLEPGADAGAGDWRAELPLPEPRGAHAAAATGDGTIVVFGGVSGGQVVATTTVLRPSATTWERGPAMEEAREHLAATVIDGRVFAIAGRVGSLESNKRTVESWDPSGREGSWRREPELVDTRGGTAASGPCVAGGEEPEGTIATVECLGAGDDDDWAIVAHLDRPRHGVAVVDVDGRLHVIAGGDRPGLFVTGTHEVILPEG